MAKAVLSEYEIVKDTHAMRTTALVDNERLMSTQSVNKDRII